MGVKWTQEQEQVISLHNRDILVSAAAGSGKDSRPGGTNPYHGHPQERSCRYRSSSCCDIYKSGCREMKRKDSEGAGRQTDGEPDNEHLKRQVAYIHNAQINTIDGFCANVIRNYFHLIDLDPGYRTADEGELKLLKADVLGEVLEGGVRSWKR